MYRSYLLVLILVIFSFGCSDNFLSGTEDKNSAKAEQDEIDFLFMKGDRASNCIVKELLVAKKQTYGLSAHNSYLYTSASLGCTGFSLTNNLKDLLGSGTSDMDPYSMIQSLMGTNIIDNNTIKRLEKDYAEILEGCQNVSPKDQSLTTICGMTAVSDTVLMVSKIALEVSGLDKIDLTSGGTESLEKFFEDTFKAGSPAQIEQAVDNALPSQSDLNRIEQNVDLVLNTVDVVADVMGTKDDIKLKDDINEVVKDIKNTEGNVTTSSLTDYINKQFVNKL